MLKCRARRLAVLLAALVLLTGLTPAGAVLSQSTAAATTWDLANLFGTETRVLLLDENGDGFTDALKTSIVLPEKPSAAEAAAAAEIGARLGFETMGMDLPLATVDASAGQVVNPILIGRENRLLKEAERGSQNKLEPLGKGQGAIQLAPGALGTTAVLVAGIDDAGTLAAGRYFAGRLPYVWDVGEGELTLSDVRSAVAGFLGIDPKAAAVTRVVAQAGKGGLVQVLVEVTAASRQQASDAHKALQRLKAAHAQGQDWDKLSWDRIGELLVQIVYEKEVLSTSLPNREGVPDAALPDRDRPTANSYDLSSLYGSWDELMQKTEGLLLDNPEERAFLKAAGVLDKKVKDYIPDQTNATIVAEGSGAAAAGAANLAARLGLETTGLNLPLAHTPDAIADPATAVNPVLFGSGNSLVQQLEKAGKVDLSGLKPLQGMVSVVPRAFGSYDAVVVAGKDDKGTAAASEYAARRLPYLWEIGRGNTTVADVEDAVKDFFAAKSAAGQAAAAVLKTDELVAGLGTPPTLNLTVYLEEESPAFAAFLKKRIETKLPGATANVAVKATKDPTNVFVKNWTDPGEAAEFWSVFNGISGLGDGTGVEVEVRLSEPPQVLDQIQAQLKSALPNAKVTVISAYKQGFSWLDRVVGPAIKSKPVKEVKISFQDFYESGVNASNWKFWRNSWTDPINNWMDLPTRWLQEIYPIDDVWKNQGVVADREQVVFDRVVKTDPNVPLAGPEYRVEVTFTDGSPTYTAEFSPTYVERDYYPGAASPKNFKVHPTTGWVKVTNGGAVVADQRIKTDPERYWDYFQAEVWPAMRDYTLAVTDGAPALDKQPFFREIKHEVYMSEPNYRLGVREEMITSLEALHEDIYFVTLDYFAILMGRMYPDRYIAPGQIAPWIRDGAPGSAPKAKVTLDALNAREPRLVVQVGDGAPVEAVLSGAGVARPSASGAVVASGADGVAKLVVGATAADAAAQARALAMLKAMKEVHAGGAYTDQMSWPKLEQLSVQVAGPSPVESVSLPRVATGSGKKVIGPTTGATLPTGPSIVRYDGPIGYEENNAILAELDKTPEVNVWLGGKSYLGRNSFVADVMLPIQSELWSQAKASTLKPTFMIIARQHANEVSSTNAGLRLVELMTKDPSYRDYLKRMNVTFVSFENVDGAIFGYELQKEQRTWMHHAARYNATGTDLPGHAFNPDTPYTDALVRTRMWQTWLPDIITNDHGFPSHEWVQQFAGYTPPGFSDYWIPRGTFYGYLNYMAKPVSGSPAIPEGEAVSKAVRAQVYDQLLTQPDIMADIQDWKDRYYKYANKWLPSQFGVQYYGDSGKEVLIYFSPSRVRPYTGEGSYGGYATGFPWITTLMWTTEIADETAQNHYMDVCARSHFYPDIGQMNVIRDADHNLSSTAEESGTGPQAGIYWRVNRERPITP